MSTVSERLRSIAFNPPRPRTEGRWFNIRLCPDLAHGELFNLGVGYVDGGTGQVHARLIDQFERYHALFGETASDELRSLLSLVDATLREGVFEPPAPQIRFSEQKFVAGDGPEEILERLFDRTVPVPDSLEKPEAHSRDAQASNDAVRKSVFSELRRIAGIAADRIIAPEPTYVIREGARRVVLDVPLRAPSRLGTVVSARYRKVQSVETNLLRASVDLETAAKVFGNDRLGLFVARPASDSGSYPIERLPQLDNVIDTLMWKLHKLGVYVGVEDTSERLASEIAGWAELASS